MRNHETDIYIDYYFKYSNEEKEHWFEYEIPESVCVEAIREILSLYNVETSNDISSKHYVKDKDIWNLVCRLDGWKALEADEDFIEYCKKACQEDAYEAWKDEYEQDNELGEYAPEPEDDEEEIEESLDKSTEDIQSIIKKYNGVYYWEDEKIIDCAGGEELKAICKELGIDYDNADNVVDTPVDHKIYLQKSIIESKVHAVNENIEKSNMKEIIQELADEAYSDLCLDYDEDDEELEEACREAAIEIYNKLNLDNYEEQLPYQKDYIIESIFLYMYEADGIALDIFDFYINNKKSNKNSNFIIKDNCIIGYKKPLPSEVVIPEGVTSIGENAFSSCDKLTSITLPSSLTSIGEYAFTFCHNLTSIIIPESVTSIREYAFKWCDKLTIYCETSSQPSGWDSTWNNDDRPVVWGYKKNKKLKEDACPHCGKDIADYKSEPLV